MVFSRWLFRESAPIWRCEVGYQPRVVSVNSSQLIDGDTMLDEDQVAVRDLAAFSCVDGAQTSLTLAT